MPKRIVATLAIIILVALAFGAGVLAQRQYQLAPIRAAEEFARSKLVWDSFTGLDDPIPPAPRWEAWLYPDAKSKGSIQGSSTRLMGKLVRPAGSYAVFVTANKFEDVAHFYAEQSNFEDVDNVAKSKLAVSSHGNFKGESNHLLDDFVDATDPQKSRPVRVKCMLRRCSSYDLTVFISRAEGENHTHILLLYDPKTETADNQK
ncbi:MAG: hypothetical protein EXS11_04145 [Gemmataceae bacterium]|nr:hypothetical protein [Gemmataceae bacterium]